MDVGQLEKRKLQEIAKALANSKGAGVASFGGAQVTSTLTVVGSVAFPVDIFHLRRALVGGTLSRAYFSLTQAGGLYACDIAHEGSGADCTAWVDALAEASRAQVALEDGDQDAATVAAAIASALGGLGVSGISVGDPYTGDDGIERVDVTIAGATGLAVGGAASNDETLRGMWGMQRATYGSVTNANILGDMGNTVVVKPQTSPGTGRVLGAYIYASGSNPLRIGVASGPTYTGSPTLTVLAQGVTSATGTGFKAVIFDEPVALPTEAWVLYKGIAGGDPQVQYRFHADTVEGNGDLVEAADMILDSTNSDPASAWASSFSPNNGVGPFGIYGFGGLIYELEDYPGDGSIDTWIGYHGTAGFSTPSATPSDTMDDETFTMRQLVPWTSQITDVRVVLDDNASGEDLGAAVYRWVDLDIPSSGTHPRIAQIGRLNLAAGAGAQTVTLEDPINVTGGWDVGVTFFGGNVDGSPDPASLSVRYDPDTAGEWLTAWVDDGRTWSDMVPAGGGGYGTETEYRTTAGVQPQGDPTATAPSSFATDATDDSPANLLRHAIRVRRAGLSAG